MLVRLRTAFFLRPRPIAIFCLTLLTLVASAARAGHYRVSFSGGTWTDASGNIHPDTDDGQDDYGTGGTLGLNPAGVRSASGAITVTYTWVHDDPANIQRDPPPQAVILDEKGYTACGAGGSCDDGLGDPPLPAPDVFTTFPVYRQHRFPISRGVPLQVALCYDLVSACA